jgi:4-amino-4-deoxy-L-arabinose transferase-like glycosyltransferase
MADHESAIRRPQSAIILRLLFVAATLLVYLAGLTMPLVGPDEPRYSQVAREMFERGDWITPTLGGFHWFEKPSLLYWLQIASYSLFGVSEFAARFGSALSGLGVIISLWIVGRHVEKETPGDHGTNIRFSDLLALIAASTVGIIAFAHGASFDIILTFPLTAAMVCYFIYDLRGRVGHLAGFYFFIGLALLAKGLIGIVFPIAIVAFYNVLMWKMPSRSFLLSLLWGTAIAITVAGTWYEPMYMRHGYEFIDQFFIQHHFQRYTSNKYLHPQPFYFFFWVLPLMTIPWTPFFIASLWRSGRQLFAAGEAGRRPQGTSRALSMFALAWLAVPLVFFSFSGSKLPGYILPAVPPAIILSATYVLLFYQRGGVRRLVVHALPVATFAFVVLAVFAFAPGFAETDSVKSLFKAASDRGLDRNPVLMLHGLTHNAEFYAPGRIVRAPDGKPRRLWGQPELRREMIQLNGQPVLVLIPVEYLRQLMDDQSMDSELIKDNSEWALVLVKQR